MPVHIRQRKALRGLLSASYATLVALVAHLLAGGTWSSGWLGLLLCLSLSTLACTVLAGRRSSLWRLSLSVGVSQWIFHSIFSAQPAQILMESQGHHAMAMHMTVEGVSMAGGMQSGMAGGMSTGMSSSLMVFAHALAALATIVGFQSTESVCQRIANYADCVLHWVLPTLVLIPALVPPTPQLRTLPHRILLPLGIAHTPRALRGPPFSFCS